VYDRIARAEMADEQTDGGRGADDQGSGAGPGEIQTGPFGTASR